MMKNRCQRGPEPSQNTIRILWGKAAGICQYKGCNEKLFYDDTTAYEFNAAYIAHIVASNPNGPRGDAIRSYQLSDKLENIMIMCDKHHRLIDIIDVTGHPEELLLEMKRQHEEDVERVCNYLNVAKTEIVNFKSPIKGNKVNIIHNDTVKAVLSGRQPSSRYGINIDIKSAYKPTQPDYWRDLSNQLEFEFSTKISVLYDNIPNVHLSVFPLAPMPLIMKLGELFSDKTAVDIYQKTRIPDTWSWQSNESTNSFKVDKTIYSSAKDIALALSLTDTISYERIQDILKPDAVFHITCTRQGVDCIKSEKDLSDFWHLYQRVCDEILNTFGRDSIIHVFPAIPVSAAFEVGRRRMPGVHPKLLIYDDNFGFIPTITIGG